MNRFRYHMRYLLSTMLVTSMIIFSGSGCFAAENEGENPDNVIQLVEIMYPDGVGERAYYSSPNKLGRIYIRTLYADVGETCSPVFCVQNRNGAAIKTGERFFKSNQGSMPYDVTRFLDYYYYKVNEHTRAHTEHPDFACTAGDEELKKLLPELWGPETLKWIGTCVQTVVWLWQNGLYMDSGEFDQLQALADEWDAILKRIYGESIRRESGLELINEVLAATDPESGWISSRAYWVYCWGKGDVGLLCPVAEPNYLELPVAGATGYALIDLPLYTGAGACESSQTIPAGTAFMVTCEVERRWQITGVFGTGWVDHTYCMVNLPDVIPSVVYDITNGYSSLFRSASHDLDGITGMALYKGRMENQRLGHSEFAVPVLYAMANKIAAAQATALAEGDTLIIYEGYRPMAAQEKVRDSLNCAPSSRQ